MSLLSTLSFVLQHPLNSGNKLAALKRFVGWQVGSRFAPGPVAVPFVDSTRLLTARGMTGATGNVYCGLHEFQDMALVMHALRPGDLFFDVGANVGVYSVLAAGVCGASVVAFEPVPATFRHLLDNIRLNDLAALVTARNVGLGAEPGILKFSDQLDTTNHVLTDEELQTASATAVPVVTLDSELTASGPALIKIDVEGYETNVLKGAVRALESGSLMGLLVELNGNGSRYGFDEQRLHEELLARGFVPGTYDPWARELKLFETNTTLLGNTLYVKDVAGLSARIKAAPRRTVHGVPL